MFIDRNDQGHIVGTYAVKQYDGQEFLEGAVLHVPPLSKLAQIRAIEAEGADDQARMNRIVSLESCLKWAMEQPAAAGLTREQVHTVLLGQNLGYARLYAKEQQIALLRAQL